MDFFDFDGRRIGRDDWLRLRPRRQLLATDLGARGRVSTIWLGIDYGFGLLGGRPPVIFETMIFGGPMDGHVCRWSTRAEARAGHRSTVRWFRENLPAPPSLLHNGGKPRG